MVELPLVTRLEDNLWLPLILAVVVGLIFHRRMRGRYIVATLAAAATTGVIWVVVLSIDSGSISNIWPLALGCWTMLALPIALVVGIPFLLRRPPRPPGFCRQCGYNLTGNVSGICPECGSRI